MSERVTVAQVAKMAEELGLDESPEEVLVLIEAEQRKRAKAKERGEAK
jgi:hypothetical protein